MKGKEWSKEGRHSRGRRWFPTDRGLRLSGWKWCLSGRWVSQNFIMLQMRGRGWWRLWLHSRAHLHLQKMQSWTACPKDNALSYRKWSDLLSLWSKERPGEWKIHTSQMQHGTKYGCEESELLGKLATTSLLMWLLQHGLQKSFLWLQCRKRTHLLKSGWVWRYRKRTPVNIKRDTRDLKIVRWNVYLVKEETSR